jgi:4-alpha-glucanotransferase
LAWQQMQQVKQYASDNEVFLKGDIPFLVSRDSSDVWYSFAHHI